MGDSFVSGIPSLREWLGDGERGRGFEEWTRENLQLQSQAKTEAEAAACRVINTLSVAMVEACRREQTLNRMEHTEIVAMLARCAGVTVMATVLCGVEDEAPLSKIATSISDEFIRGLSLVVASAETGRPATGE